MWKITLILFFFLTISISCDRTPTDDERLILYFIKGDYPIVLYLDKVNREPGVIAPEMGVLITELKNRNDVKLFFINPEKHPLLWGKYYSSEELAFVAIKDSVVQFTGLTEKDVIKLRNLYDTN